MKMRSISNDEYVFGSPVRDGPNVVQKLKTLLEKIQVL